MFIEDIYNFCGKYDRVCTVYLAYGSESFKIFGSYITGRIIYSKTARQAIEESLETNPENKSNGMIRMESSSDLLSKEHQIILMRDGIDSNEIIDLASFYRSNKENLFKSNETRQLPEPRLLELDTTGVDYGLLLLNLYKRKIKDGYRLAPPEEIEMLTLDFIKNNEKIPDGKEESYIDSNGSFIEDIRYSILKEKFLTTSITEEEIEEFKIILDKITKKKVDIFLKELARATPNLKQYIQDNIQKIRSLLPILSFDSELLTHGKFPIWLNAERLIHIYMGHVKEFQLGERYLIKTPFQYNYKDIMKLIEMVLNTIDDEVNEHFSKSPEKDLRKTVYFNGDYYKLHINTNGLLLAFHKI